MNTERIRELAEQAGDDWDHTLESDKEFLKKFALLIVKECIFAVEDAGGIEKYYHTKAISKHFGVEE